MKISSRAAFTLIELLVVIAIICILAGILVPSITVGLDRARRASCLNNVKELTESFLTYAGDHKGHLPATDGVGPTGKFSSLDEIVVMMFTNEYVTASSMWVCPADKQRTACPANRFNSFSSAKNCSYIYFAGYNLLKAADDLAKLPLVADKPQGGSTAKLTDRDAHGAKYRNVGYAGGASAGLRTADEANAIVELPQLKDYGIEILE